MSHVLSESAGIEGDVPDVAGDKAQARRKDLVEIVSTYIKILKWPSIDLIVIVQKKIICISMIMQSANQRCNKLQSIVGIFLHPCNVPETVVELLADMGVSISTTAINEAVKSLSKESAIEMQQLGQSLQAVYAYDNLDIDLKHSTPTLEKMGDTLIHLTMGTMLPLHPSVSLKDLDCSDEVWKRSKLNKDAHPRDIPVIKIEQLLNIHAEKNDHPSGLLRRDRFNAWKFLQDLIEHGPKSFAKFKKNLKHPDVIEQIPITKTCQVPNRALDI